MTLLGFTSPHVATTLTYPVGDRTIHESEAFGSTTGGDGFQWWRLRHSGAVTDVSRESLLARCVEDLVALSTRTGEGLAKREEVFLRIIADLLFDGAPTPQIGDNGDGGPRCEWLVDGYSVVLDAESENELILWSTAPDGSEIFSGLLNSRWSPNDGTVAKARQQLVAMSKLVVNRIV